MRQVTLQKLKCFKTEDWFGGDECRLEVLVDNVLQPSLNQSLQRGQTRDLNATYIFNNRVEVKLWDEDAPDPNDFLGSVTIDTSLQTSARALFTEDDARYELQYSVTTPTAATL